MWFFNFCYQNVLQDFAHFTPNYGSPRTINNVKNEENIWSMIMEFWLITHKLKVILSMQRAPYKKGKRFYETSQKYLFVTYDEVTIDITSWASIHGYKVKFWFKMPILIFVEHVTEGANVNHCTMVIMEVVQFKGGFGDCHKTNNIWCMGSWSCSSLIFVFQSLLSCCIYSYMFIFCLHSFVFIGAMWSQWSQCVPWCLKWGSLKIAYGRSPRLKFIHYMVTLFFNHVSHHCRSIINHTTQHFTI
jgi:hypothetical protein